MLSSLLLPVIGVTDVAGILASGGVFLVPYITTVSAVPGVGVPTVALGTALAGVPAVAVVSAVAGVLAVAIVPDAHGHAHY